MRNLDATDPTFVRDLLDSQEAVWLVARWLSRRGNNVTVRAIHVRPTVETLAEYGDAGDLEIVNRIEVKHRRLPFTSAADYPYRTVTVDVAHAWDRAHPKPFAYVILNQSRTVAALVLRTTARQWERVTKHDHAKHRDRTFYECPVDLVRFLALECER